MALAGVAAFDADALRADVEALAAIGRGSASEGERASAQWVAGRLRDAGAQSVAVEPFRFQGTYAAAHALHAMAGLVALRARGPRGAVIALAALASLELEVSGRRQWLRSLLPRSDAFNVIARVPAAGERRTTLILVAHHDAARTGMAWHPALIGAGAGRAQRNRWMEPRSAPVAAGFLLAAAGALAGERAIGRGLRRGAAAVLGLTVAALADVARSPTVPGANDNASGVAALLALARHFAAEPLEGVEVVLLAPGCEESGMGGMAAYLRAHAAGLDRARTLVLGLDTIGSGTPIVCTAEATLLPHAYGEAELALADRGAARAGVEPPQRWRVGAWTDPVLATYAGLPALSILSVRDGVYSNWHWPTDTPDRVDFDCVARCTRLALGIAQELKG